MRLEQPGVHTGIKVALEPIQRCQWLLKFMLCLMVWQLHHITPSLSIEAAVTAVQIFPVPAPFQLSADSSFRQVCIFWVCRELLYRGYVSSTERKINWLRIVLLLLHTEKLVKTSIRTEKKHQQKNTNKKKASKSNRRCNINTPWVTTRNAQSFTGVCHHIQRQICIHINHYAHTDG